MGPQGWTSIWKWNKQGGRTIIRVTPLPPNRQEGSATHPPPTFIPLRTGVRTSSDQKISQPIRFTRWGRGATPQQWSGRHLVGQRRATGRAGGQRRTGWGWRLTANRALIPDRKCTDWWIFRRRCWGTPCLGEKECGRPNFRGEKIGRGPFLPLRKGLGLKMPFARHSTLEKNPNDLQLTISTTDINTSIQNKILNNVNNNA